MVEWRLNFEISPLREQHYTGIAHLTASLVEEMLGDRQEVRFFHGRTEVPRIVIEDITRRRSGILLEWFLSRASLPQSPTDLTKKQVAIYSNRKSTRRFYDFECQMIYDLSALLTPDYHHHETVSFYSTSFLDDWRSNDINFCISAATRDDVATYFPEIAHSKLVTLPLAPGKVEFMEAVGESSIPGLIIVLGTIEPRKNIEQVLSMLGRYPHLASEYKFVFLGRFGWGKSLDEVIARAGCTELYRSGKIIFPGFVSEYVKNDLLRRAELLIYPSRFEGFGLPVVEALAAGVSVLAARSSSLPEAGGTLTHYFDPFLNGDFEVQFTSVLIENKRRREEGRLQRIAWGSRFSWRDTYKTMCHSIDDMLRRDAQNAH
jgi:glycosyltransferase involved in cell wall biosynthesis